MVAHENSTTWAEFEASFEAAAFDALKMKSSVPSSSSGASWMNRPVGTTASVTPMAPPDEPPRRGSAVSMDRWSKQIQVKSKKSDAKRSTSLKMVAGSPSHHSGKTLKRSKSKQDNMKRTQLENSRTTCSTASFSSESDSNHKRSVPFEVDAVLSSPRHNGNRGDRTKAQKQSDNRGRRREVETLEADMMGSKKQTRERESSHKTNRSHSVGRQKDPSRSESSRRRASSQGPNSDTLPPPVDRMRNKPEPIVTSYPDHERASRSTSVGRSRPPEVIETSDVKLRIRSSSQTTSSQHRGRSTSRPPLTRENSRVRSTSRSASLTRVTNDVASPRKPSHGGRPPPSTYRTQKDMRMMAASPASRGRARTMSEGEGSIGYKNRLNDCHGEAIVDRESQDDLANKKKPSIMEKLFGDQVEKPLPSTRGGIGSFGYEFRPRILLAATVYHNSATSLWITTVNTNQKGVAKNPATANKFLKAFSFATEREARESAIANAPPKMIPLSEATSCFVCKGKFAVFRRAHNCRNCGVCVCNSCTVTWNSKSVPQTYNLKNDAQVKVCLSCNSLSMAFKKSLLSGDFDEALELYGTGNVNLRTPFPMLNKKDELMWPVHCAVEGGNLNIIRWLIDEHFCPIKFSGGLSKNGRRRTEPECPILTSKGRSILTIALECHKVDIMRYIVADCAISVTECKDLKSALGALEAALLALPRTISQLPVESHTAPEARWDKASYDELSEPSSLGIDDNNVEDTWTLESRSHRSRTSRADLCIICFDNKIDCVATPCGHQVCCLDCSASLLACPVCSEEVSFIKIYRP